MPTKRLTERDVEAAKAKPGERLELWDTLKPGLALRVSDSGRKTWILRYRTIDGRQPRMTLGTYPTLPLADARTQAEDSLRVVQAGGDPAANKKRQRAEAKAQPLKTFDDLATTYFTACETGEWRPRGKKKRAATIERERGIWRRDLKPTLGDDRIEDVTPTALRSTLRAIAAAGKGTTANRARALARQMFNFAIAEGRVDVNPVAKVAAPAPENTRERILADAELSAFWSAMLEPSDLRKPLKPGQEKAARVYVGEVVSIAVRLLLLTLTRRAEMAGMRRDELDLEQATWVVPGERTKNGKPMLVTLPDEAVRLIRRALELVKEREQPADRRSNGPPIEYVFPSPADQERPITPGALSHVVRDVRLALRLPHFQLHDLRRTAASVMVSERLKVTPFLIGRLLNHTSETGGAAAVTLQHYALYDYAPEKRAALKAWAALLLEIVAARPTPGAQGRVRA